MTLSVLCSSALANESTDYRGKGVLGVVKDYLGGADEEPAQDYEAEILDSESELLVSDTPALMSIVGDDAYGVDDLQVRVFMGIGSYSNPSNYRLLNSHRISWSNGLTKEYFTGGSYISIDEHGGSDFAEIIDVSFYHELGTENLANKNEAFSLNFEQFNLSACISTQNKNLHDYEITSIPNCDFYYILRDESYLSFEPDNYSVYITPSTGNYVLDVTTPILPQDILGIRVLMSWKGTDDIPVSDLQSDDSIQITIGFDDSNIELIPIDTSVGFLEGIIGWLSGIYDTLQLFSLNIIDGIVGLFVPSDGFFDGYIDNWDLYLSEHFGFMYQSVGYMATVFDIIVNAVNAEPVKTLTIPEFSWTFGDTEFVFGGWDVQIVPEGFTTGLFVLKTIINVVVTLCFINVAYSWYESLMGFNMGHSIALASHASASASRSSRRGRK